ncbi:TolB family protein [Rhodoflexus sp.]
MLRLIICLAIVWMGYTLPLAAQDVFDVQQMPFSVRWQQLRTPEFRLIFPADAVQEAQRTANILNTILHPGAQSFAPIGRSLGRQPRHISVLLQNRTTFSNGFVAFAPRRSEFFTMPPQNNNDFGTADWLALLSVHEMRHVVQYDKAKTGLSRLVYWLSGYNGLGAVANLAAPWWFFEGDAVGIETLMLPGGRGRLPSFDLLYRTQVLSGSCWGYHKAHQRSFRDAVPDHYVLGYHLTSYLRRKGGAQALDRITQHAFAWPIVPFTFSNGIRKVTGRSLVATYRDMNRELDSIWRNQQQQLFREQPVATLKVARHRHYSIPTYTDFALPQPLANGRVIALRQGMSDIPQIVVMPTDSSRHARVIFTPGLVVSNGMFSAEADKAAWVEYEFDPRWQMRNYQVIKILDLVKGSVRTLARKTRYAAAALSPQADKIATIEVATNSFQQIRILDSQSGEVLQSLPNADSVQYSMLRYDTDGQHLLCIRRRTDGSTALSRIHLPTENVQDLLPFGYENIGAPAASDDWLFFHSSYSGIDNIYALDKASGRRWQVTARPFGAYHPKPSPDGKFLYFNDFDLYGMEVARLAIDTTLWIPFEQTATVPTEYFRPLLEQEGELAETLATLKNPPRRTYPTRKYGRFSELLNIYSWSPFINPNNLEQLEIALYSRNLLSTAITTVGYRFNANEQTGSWFGQFSYQGFYPILDLNLSSVQRRTNVRVNNQMSELQFTENVATLGARIPLVLTNSRFLRSANIGAAISSRQTGNFQGQFADRFRSGNLWSGGANFSYASTLRRAERDIVSRLGFTTATFARQVIASRDFEGGQFATQGQIFLPGALRHHALTLRGSMQYEQQSNYRFLSPILFARGYAYRSHEWYYGSAVEYRMPLWYPDISLGPVANLQRIKTMLFYDNAVGDRSTRYQTLGIDLTMDFNLGRMAQLLFDAGLRLMYFPQTQTTGVEIVVGRVGIR